MTVKYSMLNKLENTRLGFSLIEMIVSLGVFSIVVTTSVGAFLMLVATNQRLQGEQSVMTNLAFALDTMTREIRTGYNYYCDSAPNKSSGGPNNIFDDSNNPESIIADNVLDCPSGRPSSFRLQGLSFYEGGDSITGGSGGRRILYFYDEEGQSIMRRVGDGDAQPVVSSGLFIRNAEFYVTGSDSLSSAADVEQPTVTIYIEAQEKNDPSAKIYYLQTTVTQRILDL